jgi:ribosome-associated protein
MKQNQTVRDKSLNPDSIATTPVARKSDVRTESNEPLDERIVIAVRAASDKKAVDMVVLDLRGIASFTDYFLITSGMNARQVQAITDEVVAQLKKEGTRAQRVEGYRTAEWVLVDYGDFIVQVFESKARQFYDLERLWRDATRIVIPDDLAKNAEGAMKPETS